ncbi:MAG TPA: hypothetical protein VN846_03635 [Candidatus Cybelea sp.]|nr:hypothetical protein [Candidatus Cybelea sp.]
MPRSFLIILSLALALPASASDIGAVKCAVNQDRVWVYESLNSFDVETRLKCGDTVEILSRVKGYVKIRTASGLEGYVPDAVFPDLPALPPDDADKPVRSVAVRPATSAAARPPAAPMTVASTATPSAPPIVAPTVAGSKAPATPENSAVVAPSAPEAVNVKPALTAPPHTQPRVKAAAPAAVVEPAAPKKSLAKPATSTTQTAKKTVTVPSPQPLASTAAVVPAKATVASTSAKMMDTSANASPARDISIAKPEAASSDLEDYPDARPENESADPACRVFFSAYGLAPAQYKWLVENRRKQYADICPAPDLSRVDYVILFAHDSDTYNSAMPAPVHTDRNGFSDFSPMTTVDTALQSISELDKARYEFVWVFHTNRGTFDPARFSARRRPQFTTDAKGSHASARAAEDAFHFIEGQGSPDR